MNPVKFWMLSPPLNAGKRAEWVHEEMELETVTCPIDEGHQPGGRRLTNISLTLAKGPVEDFVWTWYSECLLQEHVLRALQTGGFSGFEVKPVKARFRKPASSRAQNLWELVVTGWGGIARRESGIKVVEHCDGCGHTVYSPLSNSEMLIDEKKWDGSDFFMVWPLPAFPFVSDRVAALIRKARWQGVRIDAPTEFEWGDIGITPGRLSYYMPEARAKELGEPLGIY
jgi:hypothetical protein